jgi:microcystin degradation protein MlrC
MTAAKQEKRIAILGFMLESNAFSPVAHREQFVQDQYLRGEELAADIRAPNPRVSASINGFVDVMDRVIGWEMVPIVMARTSPSGPVDQAFFDELIAEIDGRLRAAAPLDGVYICEHGAATATVEPDPDGGVFRTVRRVVGPDVPVVATLDLHTNVSRQMVDETDLLIAYRTNPHVDQYERGEEAARAMLEMFDGMRTAKAFVKLPLMPPTITQRTTDGPYGDAIRYAESKMAEGVLNVSICAGFFLSDTVKAGMSVVVTTRGDRGEAEALAQEIAERVWADRYRYVPKLTALDQAVAMMAEVDRDPGRPALLFADVADNPGGGGRSNTTYLLRAFLERGFRNVTLGVFYDPELAAEAHGLREGAHFQAVFNRSETSEFSERLEAEAEVIRLSNGRLVGRRGAAAGRTISLGRSARIRVGGIDVIVTTSRVQCTDPAMLEHFGIDLTGLRGLIIKSRGHFRAGFDEHFPDERIVEVDAPGLATQVISRLKYRNVPRPIFPLDPDMKWSPPG